MQHIINEYKALYKVTGSKIQEEKSFFYSWKWININRGLEIVNIEEIIQINSKRIEQVNIDYGVRALDVYLTLKLT